nr:hypothetical protein [Catellatospora citrea]
MRPRRAEDVIVDRALSHLHEAAGRDDRIAHAHDRIAAHVRHLRGPIPARETYGLVHGELGPDHVLVTPDGEPVLIDIEGLTYFDVDGSTPSCTCASATRIRGCDRSTSTRIGWSLPVRTGAVADRGPTADRRHRLPRPASGCWTWPSGTSPRHSPSADIGPVG